MKLIGVSLNKKDTHEKIVKFKKDHKGKYPEVEGTKYGAEIFSKYKGTIGDYFPNLALIDPKSKKIIWNNQGYKTYDELVDILTEHGVEK